MDKKTDIHQFTFLANQEQTAKLSKFAILKGEVLYDAKLKVTENTENEVFSKISIKFSNCGKNIAGRRLAEFILNSMDETTL